MNRSLALGGSVLLAGTLLAFLAWSIVETDSNELESVSADSAADLDGARRPTVVDLEDPDPIDRPVAEQPLEAPARAKRSVAAPRLVDASSRTTGVDLHGTIKVVGGEQKNLPALTLFFRRSGGVEETVAVQGDYLLAAVAPGHWIVSAEAPGYLPLATEVDVPAEPRSQQLDFTIERLPHLYVSMVTPQGAPLMKALREEEAPVSRMTVIAVATREPPRERLGATLDDDFDRYGLGTWRPAAGWTNSSEAGVPLAGLLELPEPMPVWVSACAGNAVLRTQYVRAGAETVEFVLSPEDLRATRGSLRFQLVDADTNEPITEGRVGLHANGQFATGNEIIRPDGSVEFDDEPPGPRDLSIVCRGYEWVVEQVWIDPGRPTDLGVYRLHRPIAIEGRVVDENGAPVRAWVSVWPVDRYESAVRIADKFCWRADAEGNFRIQPAGKRRYLLRANDEEWASEAVLVDASAGAVRGVTLRVVPGVPVTVEFDPAMPRGARLGVRDARGSPIADRAVNPGGSARIRLFPGWYRAHAEFDGLLHDERSFEMAGRPVSVVLGP